MKFLIETRDSNDFEIIQEAINGSDKKSLFITGPFIQTEVVNHNKRLYKKDIVSKEVDRYIKEKIDTNSAYGELNHPNHPEPNPERAAIKIVSLNESGNDFIGKAKVMESMPMGNIVYNLIKEGIRLGVSTRALASLTDKGTYKLVGEDFKLMTAADVVGNPSAPDAYVTALMENKEWAWSNGNLFMFEDEIKNNINKLSKYKQLNEDNLIRVFNDILNKI